jgi:cobalt/nickel transport system permease protein
MLLLHLGAFHLDRDRQKATFWNSLAPRTRLLCVLLLVFAIALTPNGRWLTWGVYGLGVLTLIILSCVTKKVLIGRIVLEFAFIGVVLLGTLFREGGEVVWSWGIFKITTEGLTVLGSVTIKALLSLIVLNILTLTTSVPALLNALTSLRVPPLLVAVLASMYRYLHVLIKEFKAIRKAALSRNLNSNGNWQRLVIGNMMGTLFVRTYDRGERIYQAMLARGYQGIPVIERVPSGGKRDYVALSLTTILTLFGQILYL